MRVFLLIVWSVALTGICVADGPDKYAVWGEAGEVYGRTELMQHGVWVAGDVINDPQQGLLFRADKAMEGNTTGNLVYLAVPEDLAKTFAPLCYRAAEPQHEATLSRSVAAAFRTQRPESPQRQLCDLGDSWARGSG